MLNKNRIAISVATALNFSIAQADPLMDSADEDFLLLYEDEEIVNIATGTSKPIHLAPSVASVITAADIKASGARTLDEALESVPGLHVSKSFNRNNSLISIRGIHTGENAQVLILINGLPIKSVVNGYRSPLFRMPVANIARVEVMRGPGSAVFGADAFAGVINIITKEGGDIDGVEVGGRVGSFDTTDIWGQYGGDLGSWDIALSVEYTGTDGDRNRIVNSDLQTTFDADAMFGTNASLTPGPLESGYKQLNTSITVSKEHWRLWFNSWNLRDAGVGPGAAQAIDPFGKQEVDHYSLVLDYSKQDIGKGWGLDSRLSYRELDEQATFRLFPPGALLPIGGDGNLLTPPGCPSPTPHPILGDVCPVEFTDGMHGNPGVLQEEWRFEVATTYTGFDVHRIRLALGFDRDDLEARATQNYGPGVIDGSVSPIDGTLTDVTGTENIFLPDETRELYYLSIQDEWSLGRDWELTAGIRYDNYSDFGSTTNPRLALVWATRYNLTSKLLYGRGFRAPSFGELYFQNNPSLTGNSSLKPETIDMVELAFDYRPSFDWHLILNLYTYQIDDLIEYVNGLAQNARKQNGEGLEFEATWQASDALELSGNYALQYSEDAETGVVIPNAPRRQLFLAANWNFAQAWLLYGQFNWIADRARADSDPRPAIDDYSTVDMALRYHARSQKWEVAARVNNLFDEDAREPSNGAIPDDYPLEGRSVFLEAIAHIR